MSKDVYRVIALADVHMSNKLPYSRPTEDGRTDRLEDQIRLWDNVRNTATLNKADAIFILGDLLDKSLVDAVTLTTTVDAIISMPCEVWILPGNHDASSVTGGRFTVEAFDAMRKDHVKCFRSGETKYVNEWLRFHPVPFCPSDEAMSIIGAYQAEVASEATSAMDVLLLHHSVVGCEHLGWTCDQGLDAELICAGFDQVLAGHFHQHQTFGPEGIGMYLGAPMHHDFGDVGRDAQYWTLDYFEDGGVVANPINSGLPKFFKAELDCELKDSTGSDPADGLWKPGDFWRYEVLATPEQWIEIKPRMLEQMREMKHEGIRASFKHIPVRTHGVRFGTPRFGVTSVTMEGFIKKYTEVAWDHKAHTADENAAVLGIGLNILSEAKDAS